MEINRRKFVKYLSAVPVVVTLGLAGTQGANDMYASAITQTGQ